MGIYSPYSPFALYFGRWKGRPDAIPMNRTALVTNMEGPMPEVLTRYPEVVIRVLQGNDARCGPEATPRILKQCPRDRFCALETGEICVYGLPDIPKMTQIRPEDLAAIVCPRKTDSASTLASGLESLGFVLAFVLGVGIGRLLRRPG